MSLIRKSPGPVTPPPAQSEEALLAALANGTDDERWAAARAAPDLPHGVKALADALPRERNSRVREAMFTSLVRAATTESAEAVLPLLRSDDAQLRTGALDALRAMKEAVWTYVPQLLNDPDADVRLLACELTRNLPDAEAAHLLCVLLDAETEPNVCGSALEVLAEVGGAQVLPVLARCEERFRGFAFLKFAIKTTADRIRSQSSGPHA